MTRRRNALTGGDTPAPPVDGDGSAPLGAPPAEIGGGSGGDAIGTGRIRPRFDPPRDLLCCRLPLTDLGNAERWRIRHGRDFRFCDRLGWFAWDGRRWRLLSEEKDSLPAVVMQTVFATVRAIANEAMLVAASGSIGAEDTERRLQRRPDKLPKGFLDDPDSARWFDDLPQMDFIAKSTAHSITMHSDKVRAWGASSESNGKLNCIAHIAKSFPEIAIEPDQLDRDRMAINVRNGTLRFVRKPEKRPSADVEAGKSQWRTGGFSVRLDKHDRRDLITKMAAVEFRAGAKCAEYDAFIERVQPDETMRRFIHQWGGLSLTGDISEQKLAFFYGAGRNGKGTWVETIAAIAGDYAGSIPIESFLDNGSKRRGDQATPDIARLPGVRFLRVSEPEKGAALNEGLIKMVTGGDPVDARHLNKGFFTFLPSFKMTVSGNVRPKVKDTSDGIWRRMQLVPWNVQIPKEEVDRKLGDRMRENEASGVLNRLIEGLLDWLNTGNLIEPEQVRAATQQYRDDSDELGRFLSQCCEVGGDPKVVRVRVSELYALYQAWSDASGGAGWNNRGFNNAMRDKRFEKIASNGEWWKGVRPLAGATVDAIKMGKWPPEDVDDDVPEDDDDRDPFAGFDD